MNTKEMRNNIRDLKSLCDWQADEIKELRDKLLAFVSEMGYEFSEFGQLRRTPAATGRLSE